MASEGPLDVDADVVSQCAEGWSLVADDYLDPVFSDGNMERPGLHRQSSQLARMLGDAQTRISSMNKLRTVINNKYPRTRVYREHSYEYTKTFTLVRTQGRRID